MFLLFIYLIFIPKTPRPLFRLITVCFPHHTRRSHFSLSLDFRAHPSPPPWRVEDPPIAAVGVGFLFIWQVISFSFFLMASDWLRCWALSNGPWPIDSCLSTWCSFFFFWVSYSDISAIWDGVYLVNFVFLFFLEYVSLILWFDIIFVSNLSCWFIQNLFFLIWHLKFGPIRLSYWLIHGC